MAMSTRSARGFLALMLVTSTALVSCRQDDVVAPTAPDKVDATALMPPGGVPLANTIGPLTAAIARPDSSSVAISIATLSLSGRAGDTVALLLRADPAVLRAAGPSVHVVVGSDSFALGDLVRGVKVTELATTGTRALTVAMTRRVRSAVRGTFVLQLYTNASVAASRSQWLADALAGDSSIGRAKGVSGPDSQSVPLVLDPEDCTLPSASGTCGGTTWAISPYFTPTVFCGTTCFTSQPNTGQSLPVTIAFNPAIASITVTIQDPTWAGNTMTAYALDGSEIGTATFTGSGMPGGNVPDTKQLIGVIDHVVLTPVEGDYVAYVAEFTPLPVGINVTCNSPLMRGTSISCTAAAANQGETLVVTGWSFRDSTPQNRVIRQNNTNSTTWGGTMAVKGTVFVDGTINGAPSTGSAQVQVTARPWTASMRTVKDHSVIATAFSSTPASFAQLGMTQLDLRHDAATSRWLSSIADDGPNAGYDYLSDLPPVTITISEVNTNAIIDTSAFYRKQEARRKKVGADWFCGRSVVWPGVLRGLAMKHEGAISPYPIPDTLPNSHPGIFRRHVDSLAYLRYEPVVGFQAQDNASPITTTLLTQATEDSRAMDNDSRNYINYNTLGSCDHFHFGPYP